MSQSASQAAAWREDVREVPLESFRSRWLDGLERDGLLVGVNWSGPDATGYDVDPKDVRTWLADTPAGAPLRDRDP